MKKLKKGFTLIELMVVMAIIAVLAVLIIGAINIARQSSRNTTRTSDAKTVQTALEAYYAANKYYPTQATIDTIYSTTNFRSTISSYLATDTIKADPSSENNRVCYQADANSSKYILYVLPEPTAVVDCNTTIPAGATDYSVK